MMLFPAAVTNSPNSKVRLKGKGLFIRNGSNAKLKFRPPIFARIFLAYCNQIGDVAIAETRGREQQIINAHLFNPTTWSRREKQTKANENLER